MKMKKIAATLLAVAAVASTLAMPVSANWRHHNNGWMYEKNNASYCRNGFEHIHGKWYLFGGDSYMKTGWQRVDDDWYYMNTDGSMATGWVKDNQHWYHCDEEGEMETGWETIGGKKYYFDNSGKMVTGTRTIDGKKCVFNQDGSLKDEPIDYGDAGEVFDAMNKAVAAAHKDVTTLMGMGTQELTEQLLIDQYGFPTGIIDSMKGYNSLISPKRGMMVVIEAKDDKVKEVKKALEKILQLEKDSAWYGNEQELAKAAKVVVEDDFVALIEIGVPDGVNMDCAADVKLAEKAFKAEIDD